MTSDYDKHHPWRCWLGGLHAGRARTRQAAMNLVDRPFRRGEAIVRNERSGEEWIRRRGWFQNAAARPRHQASDAPVSMTTGSGGGTLQGSSPAERAAEPSLKQGVLL